MGIDIAAKVEIYGLLNRLARDGAGILLLSSDLLELVGVCDRVHVIYRGRVVGEFSGETLDSDQLLAASAGATKGAGAA